MRDSLSEVEVIVTTKDEEVYLEDEAVQIAWKYPGKVVSPKKGDTILVFDADAETWNKEIVQTVKGKKIRTLGGYATELDGRDWKYPGKVVPPKRGDAILVFDDEAEKWVKQVVKEIKKDIEMPFQVADEDEDRDAVE